MPATILVIDDDAHQREICSAILKRRGHTVLYATNGREGVGLAQESLPDIILMDIRMPVLRGIEALHELKQYPTTAHIPVIAITADLLQRSRAGLLKEGFHGYIAKPCRPLEILHMVQQITEKVQTAAS